MNGGSASPFMSNTQTLSSQNSPEQVMVPRTEAQRKQRDHFAGFLKPDSDGGGDAPKTSGPQRRGWGSWMVVAGLIGISAAVLLLKGSGLKTYAMCKISPGYWERMSGPEVVGTWPGDGGANVRVDATLKVNLSIPNGAIDDTTITPASVVLIRTRDQKSFPATVSMQNDGALLAIKPAAPLEAKTQYTLLLTAGVKDGFAKPLRAFSVSFTTAGKSDPKLRFNKIALGAAQKVGFTCVLMSPIKGDRTLYAASDDGRIFRFAVLADGTLAPPQIITSL